MSGVAKQEARRFAVCGRWRPPPVSITHVATRYGECPGDGVLGAPGLMTDSGSILPFADESAGAPAVRGFLHTPAAATGNGIVLTHGAGSNCNAPILVAIAAALAE